MNVMDEIKKFITQTVPEGVAHAAEIYQIVNKVVREIEETFGLTSGTMKRTLALKMIQFAFSLRNIPYPGDKAITMVIDKVVSLYNEVHDTLFENNKQTVVANPILKAAGKIIDPGNVIKIQGRSANSILKDVLENLVK